MERRGMNHASPLAEFEYDGPPGRVDAIASVHELARRCPTCREQQKKEHETMRRRLSPTKVREYLDPCPMAWARLEVYGETLPPQFLEDDVESEIRMRFGSAWHAVVEDWLKRGVFTRDDLLGPWRETTERHFGYLRDRSLAQKLIRGAYPFLVNFEKSMKALGLLRTPLGIEKTMSRGLGNGWTLSGRLDAAWQHGSPQASHGGGILEIVDWKSGRGVKGEETLRKDLQARTYAMLAMDTWEVDRVQVTFHYTMMNRRTSTVFTRSQVEAYVLRRYLRVADQIERRAFPQANDAKCWECPFTKAGRPCAGSPPALAAQVGQPRVS